MKLIAFFTFVATVSASTAIFPSTNSKCIPVNLATITKCGDTNLLDYDIDGARIVIKGPDRQKVQVTWFKQSGCKGDSVTVNRATHCFELPFTPRCVRIGC
jgi:hypothetical protein